MDRRKLLKAIPAAAVIPIMLSENARVGGLCEEDYNGGAYKLEKGKNYLFVFKAGTVSSESQLLKNLSTLGISGTVQYVYDEPEEALRIYEVG